MRSMRSDPPPNIGNGDTDRRRTFSAALAQSEELWTAAASVTANVKPIILFYGLAQATQAIGAARPGKKGWTPCGGHGLKLPNIKPPPGMKPAFADITVQDDGNKGWFQRLAKILDSPALPRATALSALIRSLPDLAESGVEGNEPPALRFVFHAGGNGHWYQVSPLPPHLRRDVIGSEFIPVRNVAKWFESYPTLKGFGPPSTAQCSGYGNEEHIAVIGWDAQDQSGEYTPAVAAAPIYDIPDRGLDADAGALLPSVAGNARYMKPLVTWWAILYTFSMLARYHPLEWIDLLHLDQSTHAVPTTLVLDKAAEVVPGLILDELDEAYRAGQFR